MSHEDRMKIKNVKLRPETVLKIKSQEGQILLRTYLRQKLKFVYWIW